LRFFKTALVVAAITLATQSNAFDLTHMIVRSALNHLPGSEHNSYGHANGKRPAQQVDVALPATTGNFGTCRETFANGEPPRMPNTSDQMTRALCFTGFAVLHSGKTKTPVYSAEVLSRSRIAAAKGESRTDVFFEDARLPQRERATLNDYKGSRMDRGHNSPAGDMDNAQAMAQSFSLANTFPQAPENNRKAWADIEKSTRKYVQRASGNVYVLTGPVFQANNCPIVASAKKALAERSIPVPAAPAQIVTTAVREAGFKAPRHYDAVACTVGNGVVVPSYLFKLVYDASSNRAWVHWLENTDWARISAPISYEELVKRTGIEFLPGVHPKS
jgi:endonuclease G